MPCAYRYILSRGTHPFGLHTKKLRGRKLQTELVRRIVNDSSGKDATRYRPLELKDAAADLLVTRLLRADPAKRAHLRLHNIELKRDRPKLATEPADLKCMIITYT